MSVESVMPSNHLILSCPLLLLPSIFPSIRVFSNGLALQIRWPKYWSFSFSISPSNQYSGLISFRTDWLDLLAVQGTLKSLLHPHSSKASILPCFLSKFNMACFYLFHECHTFFLRALQMFFELNPRFLKNSFCCFTDYIFYLFVVMCLKSN